MPDEPKNPVVQRDPSPSELQRLRNILYADHASRVEAQIEALHTRLTNLQHDLLATLGAQTATLDATAAAHQAAIQTDIDNRSLHHAAQLTAATDHLQHQVEQAARAHTAQLVAAQTTLSSHVDRHIAAVHQQLEQVDAAQADRLTVVQAGLLAEIKQTADAVRQQIDQLAHDQALRFDALLAGLNERFDQQAAQLTARADQLTATQQDILKRLDQHAANLAETHRVLIDGLSRLTRQIDEQQQVLRSTLLEHMQQHEATWITAQQELLSSSVKITQQLNSQAQAHYIELSRRLDKLDTKFTRRQTEPRQPPAPPSPPGAPPLPVRPAVSTAGKWADEIRQWRHFDQQSALAERFVRLFQRAIEQLPDQTRQAAWFGVHADRISLTVGNIALASVSANDQSIQLLVEADWDQAAGLTQNYTPLGWKVFAWKRAAALNRAKHVWLSYEAAAVKVWDAPIARTVIKRNLIHKRRVRSLLSAGR